MSPSVSARVFVGVLMILAVMTQQAHADSDKKAEARSAYERGAAAFDRHEYAAAATDLARADELVPNPVSLSTAIRAAVLADDAVLAMQLAERAESRESDPTLSRAVDSAHQKYASRTGRVRLSCPGACRAMLDDQELSPRASQWVLAGEHELVLNLEGRIERRSLKVAPGAQVEVSPTPGAAAPRHENGGPAPGADSESSNGLSPMWFWIGAATTAVVGSLTVASALDFKKKHEDFQDHPTDAGASDGKTAQTRTNVLLGVTGVAAITTAALGLFAVRWSNSSAPRAGLLIDPHGAHLSVSGSY